MMKEEAAIKQPCSSMALKWAELKQHYFSDCGRPRPPREGEAAGDALLHGRRQQGRQGEAGQALRTLWQNGESFVK